MYALKISTRVQSDALGSYQPPFNILAFLILNPATFFLSPRALHSVNVFLIKLTTLPILIVIGMYDRYFAVGSRFRKSSADAAHSLFNSLPRHVKNMPLVEALMGSSSGGLYGAIFDVDVPGELDLFDDSEDEFPPGLHSFHSRDNLQRPSTPTSKTKLRRPSSARPPSHRSLHPPLSMEETPEIVPSASGRSTLAMLFGPRVVPVDYTQVAASASRAEASVRKVEELLGEMRDLPVEKLKEGMKELQVCGVVMSMVFNS